MADELRFAPYVLIDGVRASTLKADLLVGRPTIMDGLDIPWGRDALTSQPDTSASPTFRVRQRTGFTGVPSIFDYCHDGATVQIWASGADYGLPDRLMWAGEIVSARIRATDPYAVEAQVTCADESLTLGTINIGREPWPEESAYQRFQRILDAAGTEIHELRPDQATEWRWQLTGEMDTTIRDMRVAFRDIDKRPPLGLIQELAASIGGIAWVTADANGPYIWIEDPTQRQGLREFIVDPVTSAVTVGQVDVRAQNISLWSASDVVPADVEWVEDPSQSINHVEVNWQRPAGLNDQGSPAYEQETEIQRDLLSDRGFRPFTVDTQLVRQPDATMLGYHWLTWAHSADWIMSDLAVDTARIARKAAAAGASDLAAQVLDLLDYRTRIGYRMTIVDLPAWLPAGTEQSFYIEGGTYTWAGNRWSLSLTATANAIGGGATFRDFTGTGATFADFDPSLRFIDIAGVAGPGGFPLGFGVGPFGATPFGR